MNIFWIIYALGIVAALYAFYRNFSSGEEVTVYELFLIIVGSLFSWVTCIGVIIGLHGDKVVFRVK